MLKNFFLKCRHALSSWTKKCWLCCFYQLLCLLDQRICLCLKRVRLWLEFRINFNWYSMRSFQRVLMRFNNLWIHFIFKEFKWVSPPNAGLSYNQFRKFLKTFLTFTKLFCHHKWNDGRLLLMNMVYWVALMPEFI